MSILIVTHSDCFKHEMGLGHPESPERLEVVTEALKKSSWNSDLLWLNAPLAAREHLERVHDAKYVDNIFNISPRQGYVELDPDALMNPYTLSAALRAAGAQIAAVDAVFNGEVTKAFCLVRPPGHHAEPAAAMGFCFFNNIAIGVAHALEKYQCKRIAIVDFDVHHGNGTESMFENEPRVCFWSSFQHPFYPGAILMNKPKNIHLCPLPAGTKGHLFRQKVDDELIPMLEACKPECIFISAGFDAHQLDPLANLSLTALDYDYVTQAICKIATKYCHGRVISTLEGGYHLQALPESVLAHINAMRETV